MDPLFFLVALQLTPRAAVLPLTPGALSLQQRSRIEAGLAVQGYSGVDPVDRAALLDDSDEAPRDSRALYVEARKAFLDFDYPKARRLLDSATRDLLSRRVFCPSAR